MLHRLEGVAEGDGSGMVIFKGPGNQHDVFGVRFETERRFHQALRHYSRLQYPADPLFERRGEDAILKRLGNGAHDHRYAGEELVAVLHEKKCSRHINTDDQIDVATAVPILQKVGQRRALWDIPKAGKIEIFGIELDG